MTKRIDVIEVPAKTQSVEILVCDFCGYEGQGQRAVRTCVVCGRHACNSVKRCVKFDPTDPSDYPDAYCPVCYDLRFVKYADDFAALDEEYEAKRDVLQRRIKDEAALSVRAARERQAGDEAT